MDSVRGVLVVDKAARAGEFTLADLHAADLRAADLTRANLAEADLIDADLTDADLRFADLHGAELYGADLTNANLCGANLRDADLRRADLCCANLRGADLRGANLDYSCWPLWCGTAGVVVDVRIAAQLALHGALVVVDTTTITPEEAEAVAEWQAACRKLGRFSHRAGLLDS